MCTAGAYRDCVHNGKWKAKMASCKSGKDETLITTYDSPRTWSDGAVVYAAGEHGDRVECEVEKGYAAVGMCSSGQYRDCMPLDGAHKNEWKSHFLVCAPGLREVMVGDKLLTEFMPQTYEKSAEPHGDNLKCDDGDVAYMMCASGMYNDCKNKKGQNVAQVLGCVRLAREVDLAKEKKLVIDDLRGYWTSIMSHHLPKDFSVSVATSITDEETNEETASSSKTYDFSQQLSIGYYRGGADGPGVEVQFGFEQGLEYEMSNTMSTTLSQTKEITKDYSCEDIYGNGAEIGERVHLYQWYQDSTLENGVKGPTVKSDNYICVPIKHKVPLCHPNDCVNKWCTRCKSLGHGYNFQSHQDYCHDYFGPRSSYDDDDENDATPEEKNLICQENQCGTYDPSRNVCVLEDGASVTCEKFSGNPVMCEMIGCQESDEKIVDGEMEISLSVGFDDENMLEIGDDSEEVHYCFGPPFSKSGWVESSAASRDMTSLWLMAILGMLVLVA